MTKGKVFLLLLVALGVGLYVEDSRAAILNFVSPVVQPALNWMTNQELKQIVADLEVHSTSRGELPLGRGEFESWMQSRYRDDRYFTDAWGNPYRLQSQGNTFRVISAGTDGEFGTDDDLYVEGVRGGRR